MILGIIGGIGSGKSTAADILKNEYGYTVIGTDDTAKELMNTDPECRAKLQEAFGEQIFRVDGTIDKEEYRKVLYSSEENKKISDAIVHPLVWKRIRDIIGKAPEKNYVIETALPGKEFSLLCDIIWVITANTDVRVQRLMQNRGYSEEYARTVIEKQLSDEEMTAIGDLVIDNSGSFEELRGFLGRAVSGS